MDRSDDIEQFIFRRALKDVSRRSRAQRALDFTIAVRSGQHDDARSGKLASNCYQGVCPVGTREAEIHQGDVWAMTTKFCYSFHRIGGLCNKKHIRLRSNDRAQSFTKYRMVLDAQDTNWLRVNHRHYFL